VTVLRHDDLTIPQGTTWGMSWPIVDDSGVPVTVDGWTVRSQIRDSVTATAVLWEWSTDDGTAEAVADTVILRLTPAQSSAWTWRTGLYDVELVDPDGEVFRLTQGRVTVDREVTR